MQNNEPTKAFFSFALVSFFLFQPFASLLLAQDNAAALLILKIKTELKSTEKAAEGVEFEVKKNGVVVSKTTSGKNGKCTIQLDVSTSNPGNEYIIYISQAGTIPKILSVNAYVPKEEFSKNPFVRFDKELEIIMIETTVKDIVIEKASGKLKWDNAEDDFVFDQTYAKIMQKEEQKLQTNPDQYLKDLAKKKKKEEEAEAKKKAIEDAKLKAEEEAKRLAEQKAKEEADRILKENLEVMKKELEKKRIADSLAELEKKKLLETANAKLDIKKITTLLVTEQIDKNEFDGSKTYNINIAKKILNAHKEKLNKEKSQNLSAKYETNNTLTSLLDMVDENAKNKNRK